MKKIKRKKTPTMRGQFLGLVKKALRTGRVRVTPLRMGIAAINAHLTEGDIIAVALVGKIGRSEATEVYRVRYTDKSAEVDEKIQSFLIEHAAEKLGMPKDFLWEILKDTSEVLRQAQEELEAERAAKRKGKRSK